MAVTIDGTNGITSDNVRVNILTNAPINGSPEFPFGLPFPIGTILPFGGGTLPSGYLECDGANVSRSTYANLFTAIGTTWGAGDGTTTFGLPDLRRRTLVGAGGTGTATLGNAVGNVGGAETHTLTVAEIPSHSHFQTHTGTGALVQAPSGGGSLGQTASPIPTQSTGGGGAHNNMQPSAVVKYMIKF